jgi:hypothetical protein
LPAKDLLPANQNLTHPQRLRYDVRRSRLAGERNPQRHLQWLAQRIAGKRAPTQDLRRMTYHRCTTSVGAGLLANALAQRHRHCLTHRVRGQVRAYTEFAANDISPVHDVRRSRLAGERNRPAPPALPDTPASRLLQVQRRAYVSDTHSRQQSAMGNRQSLVPSP